MDSYEYSITKEYYTKSLSQIKRFLNGALKKQIDYIDSSLEELKELIKIIGKQGKEFDRINVFYLINGFSNHEKERIEINNIDVFVQTWDISRLFKIIDSGLGIPKELQEKIMQPFFTTKGVGKGTGLGLAIVKGIVEEHKGEFMIDSKSQNTCFILKFPKAHNVS